MENIVRRISQNVFELSQLIGDDKQSTRLTFEYISSSFTRVVALCNHFHCFTFVFSAFSNL